MHIPSFPSSTRKIITLLLVWGIPSFLFAQEAGPDLAANRGFIEYHEVPEAKKGTIIFEAAPGHRAKDIAPQPKKDDLTDLQKKARVYRSQGWEFQRAGDIDRAMSSYKNAIASDPAYAVAYNDLGVIYETKGLLDLAEENYLKAVNIDPYYLSAYSNLALLYEQKHQLDKADFYWRRRVELGCTGDPWTEKAKKHLEDIRVASQDTGGIPDEQKILGLIEEALEQADNPEQK